MAYTSINRRVARSVYDPELRELDLIWASAGSCIPFTEDMMWDPYAFPMEENQGLTLVETETAPGFLLFLWKQTPTLFMRQRKCFLMHELRG